MPCIEVSWLFQQNILLYFLIRWHYNIILTIKFDCYNYLDLIELIEKLMTN